MTVTDIATRTYNHGWRLDPIIRSLLDTDFYKLLMLQMIRAFHPEVQVTFSLINRSKQIRLADIVDEAELRAQLDHARSVRFTKKELIWLAGNSFYGKRQMFSPEFLAWLADFQLPDYELRRVDGQYELHFEGPWTHTTMWEVPALAIINELRARRVMVGQKRFALDVLYARAKAKMWDKVERLQRLPNLKLSDFGTRRRHGHLWQRWCVEALKEGLGSKFSGTSNVLLAMDADLEAIGTNAHELPMVLAALAESDAELLRAPYRVLDEWRQVYGGNLLIACRTPSERAASCVMRRTGWRTGRAFGPIPRRRSRRARRSWLGGASAGAIPRRSCWSSRTGSMSMRSSGSTGISTARSAWPSAGAPISPTISSAACPTARARSTRCRWSARSPRRTGALL